MFPKKTGTYIMHIKLFSILMARVADLSSGVPIHIVNRFKRCLCCVISTINKAKGEKKIMLCRSMLFCMPVY